MTAAPDPGHAARPLAGGDPFDEAWQVELVATALALAESGSISEAEWAEALGAAIAEAQRGGDADLGDTYHHHCLHALEQLCVAKGLLTSSEVDRRADAWRSAHLRTPHGQPVVLHPDADGDI